MPPDLNSLPPSPPSSALPPIQPIQPRMAFHHDPAALANTSPAPSSHSPPRSLQAAATMNAGIHNEDSRRPSLGGSVRRDAERARRRSSIRMNLNLNDPALPSPGEMQMSPSMRSRVLGGPHSPHHERAPSLGELHQELENEQEAQVNRLLNMIRQQQAQIAALSSNQATGQANASSAVVDDSTPTSERSLSLPQSASASQNNVASGIGAPALRSRSPHTARGSLSRHSSYRDPSQASSQANSPMLRPTSSSQSESNDWALGQPASRDESAFYQAETQMLTRENQMLKLRIRELERQLAELNPTSPITRTPVTASNLHSSPPQGSGEGRASSRQQQQPASAPAPVEGEAGSSGN